MKVKIHLLNKLVLLANGQLICMSTLHQILMHPLFSAIGKSFDLQIPTLMNDETHRIFSFLRITMNFSESFEVESFLSIHLFIV